jgi:hypothetical protein
MQSSYAHTKPQAIAPQLAGLSDFTGVIESSYGTVRITDRYANAIKVQIQTDRAGGAIFRTPFKCLDAFVAVRDYETKEIIGGSLIVTKALKVCFGSALINFNKTPASNKIILELYKGGTVEWFESEATLQGVKDGWVDLIATSQPIDLSALDRNVNEGGLIQDEKENKGLSALGDAKNILKYATILTAAGAGVYFLAPFAPAIKSGLSSVADKFKDDK